MFIGDKYKIDTDPLNFILKVKANKKQKPDEEDDDFVNREPGWVIDGYFYDFRELLKYIIDSEIKGVGLSDLKAVAKKQEELYNLIFLLTLMTPDQFHTKLTKEPHTALKMAQTGTENGGK